MSERPQPPRPQAAGGERGAALHPAARSRTALPLAAAAALGRFELQACAECGTVQYPPRDACERCLSSRLTWQPQPQGGELICETMLHHSHEAFFRERLPWRIGMVRLDCGPTAITHVHRGLAPAPARVRIVALLDRTGRAVLVAVPEERESGEADADLSDDRKLRELIAAPGNPMALEHPPARERPGE
jgi:uncharacterized OB-fold protein